MPEIFCNLNNFVKLCNFGGNKKLVQPGGEARILKLGVSGNLVTDAMVWAYRYPTHPHHPSPSPHLSITPLHLLLPLLTSDLEGG